MTAKTFSGPRAIFMYNRAAIGYAAQVSGEEIIDYQPVDVLNSLEVKEHVPVAYRVSLSAQIFRVVGESLKAQGIMPSYSEIITLDDMEAAIQDSVTGQSLALFQGVRCSGHTFDIGARGIVQSNVTFVAIRVLDEKENPL